MFRERLEEIAGSVDGVQAIALVAADGIAVDSISSSPEIDVEMIAAELVVLIGVISDNHRELGWASVRSLEVGAGRMTLSLTEVDSEFYLLLVTDARIRSGRARFELRRAPLALAAELA